MDLGGRLQLGQDIDPNIGQRRFADEEVAGRRREAVLRHERGRCHLGNVFSEFLQIANTQFVENRVYEIDANPDEESGAGNNVEGGNKQGSADASNTVDPGERAEQGPGEIQVSAVPRDQGPQIVLTVRR